MHALVPILEKSKELLKYIEEAETEQCRLHRSTTVRTRLPGAQYLQYHVHFVPICHR